MELRIKLEALKPLMEWKGVMKYARDSIGVVRDEGANAGNLMILFGIENSRHFPLLMESARRLWRVMSHEYWVRRMDLSMGEAFDVGTPLLYYRGVSADIRDRDGLCCSGRMFAKVNIGTLEGLMRSFGLSVDSLFLRGMEEGFLGMMEEVGSKGYRALKLSLSFRCKGGGS